MNYTVQFRRLAEVELERALAYYAEISPDLARRFQVAVDAIERKIVENPMWFAIEEDDTRLAVVEDFPYSIYFRVVRNRIFITSVFHQSRDPEGWKGRK